jgi:hypothetical protein
MKRLSMTRTIFAILLVSANAAYASGPISPKGWNGSNEPVLSNGQQCCIPADLNGTGLTGGAFVLLSDNKKEFAVFALTYSSKVREKWHFLEKHPVSELSSYHVTIESRGRFPLGGIKVCSAEALCMTYYTTSESSSFIRSSQ